MTDHWPTSPGDHPWDQLTTDVKVLLVQAMAEQMTDADLDEIYHRWGYLVEMPGSPIKRSIIV